VNFPELPPPPVARTAGEWVALRSDAVEDYVRKKTCAECHVMAAGANGRLETVPTASPVVSGFSRTSIPSSSWMPRARFDHRAHQMTTCESCHAAAAASTETSDVLVPGIETCRQCHNDTTTSADARCFVCHDYHDWSKPTVTPAGFDIRAIAQ
jgi:predicted CXXCH cytochrome family protein